jgi:hypothetical protein
MYNRFLIARDGRVSVRWGKKGRKGRSSKRPQLSEPSPLASPVAASRKSADHSVTSTNHWRNSSNKTAVDRDMNSQCVPGGHLQRLALQVIGLCVCIGCILPQLC